MHRPDPSRAKKAFSGQGLSKLLIGGNGFQEIHSTHWSDRVLLAFGDVNGQPIRICLPRHALMPVSQVPIQITRRHRAYYFSSECSRSIAALVVTANLVLDRKGPDHGCGRPKVSPNPRKIFWGHCPLRLGCPE